MKMYSLFLMVVLGPFALAIAQPTVDGPIDESFLAWVDQPMDGPLIDFADVEALEMGEPNLHHGPEMLGLEKEGICQKLNLTDAQKKTMRELRLKHQKELIPLQGDLKSKRIDLQVQMQADKPDLTKINELVDQMAKTRADIVKNQIAFRFKMRDQLTPEQLKIWDEKKGMKMREFRHGRRGFRGPREPFPPKCPNW